MRFHETLTKQDFLSAYDEYADRIFRHCHLRIADRERSKELTCKAFKELWMFASEGNTVDSIKIFLYRSINALIEAEVENPEEATPLPSKNPLGFLHGLPSENRCVCVLYYVDGFSIDEIHDIIGDSIEHLRTILTTLGLELHELVTMSTSFPRTRRMASSAKSLFCS